MLYYSMYLLLWLYTQSKKQNAEFVQLIEKQHVDKLIRSRKHKNEEEQEEEEEEVVNGDEQHKKRKRSFHQAKVLGTNYDDVQEVGDV